MMVTRFLDIEELTVYGPFDRNKPNLERIVILPNEVIDLSRYMLFLGIAGEDRSARILTLHNFSFPSQLVTPDTWVYLFTGPGQPLNTTVSDGKGGTKSAWVLHWGIEHTVFSREDVVPVVAEIKSIWIGEGPLVKAALPQPQSPF